MTRYRVIFTLLGVALVAIIVGAVVLSPDGRAPSLPAAVDGYAPADGDLVLRQTRIEVDLQVGYEIELVIDDVPIPDAEIQRVEATGLFTWTPGPGKTFESWAPGFHAVVVRWDRTSGLPDPGSLRWSFRAQ